ncbi:GxxExxY protein [Fodinibius salsisoli]|uniref:GxxExxY protein n=1 Tax=Fodinibius salsisoli TaxID=2820877 RepID=A0ABT3PSN9_9BACT|nr:GxxExxY protein [Fodinibius salsisoli]MCW9708875.1 GxxExxY protein [Fodinibius salsisoli]
MEQADKHNQYDPISPELEKIGKGIVDSAYRVHKSLGPGLLEKIYEICFCHELSKKAIQSRRQVALPIHYEGLRLDVLVADEVICELKALDEINPVWEAQILSHLKLLDKRLGYLINFNVKNIGKGIKRFVN